MAEEDFYAEANFESDDNTYDPYPQPHQHTASFVSSESHAYATVDEIAQQDENGTEQLPDDTESERGPFDPLAYHGAFWASSRPDSEQDAGFEELKKLVNQGNDFCRDVAALYKERAAVEEAYAKSLQKLQAKATKVGDHTYGTLKACWSRLLLEFKETSNWHITMAEMLKKRVCDPLAGFKDQLKKDCRAAEVPVEKAYKTFQDSLAAMSRAQKTAFSKSKDVEAQAVSLDCARSGSDGKVHSDKDIAKLEKSVEKAEASRKKTDSQYQDAIGEARLKRDDWETEMITGCKKLQRLEEKRIAFLKTQFNDFAHVLNNTLAERQKTYGEILRCADEISQEKDIMTQCQERGIEPYVSIHPLYTVYEQCFSNEMDNTRRTIVLKRQLENMKHELAKRSKTREGLVRLRDASINIEEERHTKPASSASSNIIRQLIAQDFAVAAAHATVHLLRSSLYDSNGLSLPKHSLAKYITSNTDKTGILHAQLRFPAADEFSYEQYVRESEENSVQDSSIGGAVAISKAPSAAAVTSDTSAEALPPPPPPIPATPSGTSVDSQGMYGVNPGNAAAYESAQDMYGVAPTGYAPTQDQDQPMYSDDDDDYDDEDEEEEADVAFEQQPQQQLSEEGATGQLPVLFVARCIYPWQPEQDDELTLQEGDIVHIHDTSDEAWWQGSVNGTVGLLPAQYVEQIDADTQA